MVSSKNIPVVLAIVVGVALIAFLFLYPREAPPEYTQNVIYDNALQSQATSTLLTATTSASALVPAGYVLYKNTKYRFSFYRPKEDVLHEFDEGAGAMTITLENREKARGFQIFIVPYTQKTITEDRFTRDVPSGVRNNIQNTVVDGVKAVTFESTNAILGETREVWFIRGGYLFEVTTFLSETDWLVPIMRSWTFN